MGLPAKLVRAQLNFFKPFVANCSLEITRKGQDKLGELMEAIHRRDVIVRDHDFGPFQGAWIMPKDERRQGVVRIAFRPRWTTQLSAISICSPRDIPQARFCSAASPLAEDLFTRFACG